MTIESAMEIIKDGLVSDQDSLDQVREIIEEIANASYHAGLEDSRHDDPVFTAYGKTEDW